MEIPGGSKRMGYKGIRNLECEGNACLYFSVRFIMCTYISSHKFMYFKCLSTLCIIC